MAASADRAKKPKNTLVKAPSKVRNKSDRSPRRNEVHPLVQIKDKDAENKVEAKQAVELDTQTLTSIDKEALRWQLLNGDSQSIFQDDGKGLTAKSFVRKVMSDQGLQAFNDAFSQLEKFPSSSPFTAYSDNFKKNRYNDIVCLDHQRVKLKQWGNILYAHTLSGKIGEKLIHLIICAMKIWNIVSPKSDMRLETALMREIQRDVENDYIHANFVDSYKQSKAFICCQGPKESTVVDFWTMIWQEDVRVIVMLTKTFETGKEKCYEYWPPKIHEIRKFGNFEIKCVQFDQQSNFNQIGMHVKFGDDSRRIAHLRFTAWPDYHIPDNPLPFLQFLGHARKLQQFTTNKMLTYPRAQPDTLPKLGPPMVVHCSAGVGRTGTFCAVDIGIRRLTDVRRIDIIETVRLLRTQRASSIQKVDQFQFVNVCLVGVALNHINEADKEKDLDDQNMIDQMQKSLRLVVQQNPNNSEN